MELPYLHPMNQSAYPSPSNYDDDDVTSSSSYNIALSGVSNLTLTFEQDPSGPCSTAARNRVRDMVKMFEGSSSSAATTPVHRADSAKPFYTGVAGGCSNTHGGSQTSVKQYVSQFQEVGEQLVKGNESRYVALGRCSGGSVGKPFSSQYPETEEQVKLAEKARRYIGPSYSDSQANTKLFMQQFQDSDEPSKVTERCPNCNVLHRCDEVHFCLGKKPCFTGSEQSRVSQNKLECANSKPGGGIHLVHLGANSNGYSVYAENRNNDVLRSPSKELSESKVRDQRPNSTDLYEKNNGMPLSLAYDSKTTILQTTEGVRIVIDIPIDSMLSLSAADVYYSRVETKLPHSRILTEFQQKSAMVMTGEESRLQI